MKVFRWQGETVVPHTLNSIAASDVGDIVVYPLDGFRPVRYQQQCKQRGVRLKDLMGQGTSTKHHLLFVSHRWETDTHPDIDEGIATLFKKHGSNFAHEALGLPQSKPLPNDVEFWVFYDYSSLPQKPRTQEEDEVFRKGLSAMGGLITGKPLRNIQTHVLVEPAEDLSSRAWIVFEACLSHLHRNMIGRLPYVRKQFEAHFSIIDSLKDQDGLGHVELFAAFDYRIVKAIKWFSGEVEKAEAINGADISLISKMLVKEMTRHFAVGFADYFNIYSRVIAPNDDIEAPRARPPESDLVDLIDGPWSTGNVFFDGLEHRRHLKVTALLLTYRDKNGHAHGIEGLGSQIAELLHAD